MCVCAASLLRKTKSAREDLWPINVEQLSLSLFVRVPFEVDARCVRTLPTEGFVYGPYDLHIMYSVENRARAR